MAVRLLAVRLLAGRGCDVPLGRVECEGGVLGEGSFEGEVYLDNLYAGVLELEVTFKVHAVNIGGFHQFLSHMEVYAVNTLRGAGNPYQA